MAMTSTLYLSVFIVYFHIIRGENGTRSGGLANLSAGPQFLSSMVNVSVSVGRDAALTCHISNSEGFSVAWVRVNTQTVLSFNEHVITKNHRIKVSNPETNQWSLEIASVKRHDAGFYMCQVNTDPMMSQLAYLDVVEPPSILSAGTSTDLSVEEGEDVVLACKASGHPAPTVTWRREGGLKIREENGLYTDSVTGQLISISGVNRRDSGAYLCIANNNVPPIVSRRIILGVTYLPTVRVEDELVKVKLGHHVRLGCTIEAFPPPVTSWSTNNRAITKGGRFRIYSEERRGFVDTSLVIKRVTRRDHLSSYKCSGQNSLGKAEKQVTIHVLDDGSDPDADFHPDLSETESRNEEIVFNKIAQNKPTLEIFELDMARNEEETFLEDFPTSNNFKTASDTNSVNFHLSDNSDLKRKHQKDFQRTFGIGGCPSIFNLGISIIFPIICLFENI